MSQALRRSLIKRLTVPYLLAFSLIIVTGLWQVTYGDLEGWFVWINIQPIFGRELFDWLTFATFIAYPIFWVLVWVERPFTKKLVIFLVTVNMIFFGYFLIIFSPAGTSKGFASLLWTNGVNFVLQGLFAFFYVITVVKKKS